MYELNKELLKTNIRQLMEEKKVTQAKLAEITEMSQPNVSKALNPKDKKCFTLEQLYTIARYFGVSLDELVGYKMVDQQLTAPRAVFALLVDLLCADKARVKKWVHEKEEVIIGRIENLGDGHDHLYLPVEYPAIYFPSHYEIDGRDYDDEEVQDEFSLYCEEGNETPFCEMNHIINKILPMIELYKAGEIPKDAFTSIVEGYLRELPGI